MATLNQKDSPCRVWRNNVGFDHQKKVHYGLGVGSSDLIGGARVLITPDMVGKTVFVFLADEIKTPKGRLTPEQVAYLDTVRRLGGIVQTHRSEEDALEFVQRVRDGRLFH